MIKHTLKTLYAWTAHWHPELIADPALTDLGQYCHEPTPTGTNTTRKSLKWGIYTLRDVLQHDELEMVWFHMLAEAIACSRGSVLYTDVFKFRTMIPHFSILNGWEPKTNLWKEVRLNGASIILYMFPEKLESLILSETPDCDLIIGLSPKTGYAIITLPESSALRSEHKVQKELVHRVISNSVESARWRVVNASEQGVAMLKYMEVVEGGVKTIGLLERAICSLLVGRAFSPGSARLKKFLKERGSNIRALAKASGYTEVHLSRVFSQGKPVPGPVWEQLEVLGWKKSLV